MISARNSWMYWTFWTSLFNCFKPHVAVSFIMMVRDPAQTLVCCLTIIAALRCVIWPRPTRLRHGKIPTVQFAFLPTIGLFCMFSSSMRSLMASWYFQQWWIRGLFVLFMWCFCLPLKISSVINSGCNTWHPLSTIFVGAWVGMRTS